MKKSKVIAALLILLLAFSGCLEQKTEPVFFECNDEACIQQKNVVCSPAVFKETVHSDLVREMKVLGLHENLTQCRVQYSFLKHPEADVSGKSMECLVPLGFPFTISMDIPELCSGELADVFQELEDEVMAQSDLRFELGGTDCLPAVYWENDLGRYEVLGVETGQTSLMDKSKTGVEEKLEGLKVCHRQFTLTYPKKTGLATIDYYSNAKGDGFAIEYDNQQLPEPIQDWCQGPAVEFKNDQGTVRVEKLEIIEDKYCLANYTVTPSALVFGVQVMTFTDNQGMTDIIVKTLLTTVEKPFYRDVQ